MLRMVLVGLLIPLGIGVLTAMELRTSPRKAVAVAQTVAETTVGISDSHGALAKADRLETAFPNSETPAQPAPVGEHIPASQVTPITSSQPPRVINRSRHDPKPRKPTAAAVSKPKPKTADIKRAAIPGRAKAAGDNAFCRLSAFGGLRKALNSVGCEI